MKNITAKILCLLFFIVAISWDAHSCPGARNRINRFFESRAAAFGNAKRDAGVNRNQKPVRVEHTYMKDINDKVVLGSNHLPILTREYVFKNNRGKLIVIQEHTAGHAGSIREAGGTPHFNVRPIENRRNGNVPGTAAHYNIGSE